MESLEREGDFTIEKSPLHEAYVLLGAHSPLELQHLYGEEDQKLMHAGAWDYNNPELVTNQIKVIMEAVEPESLTEDEREWRQEILWFWYHHAISCAVWRYKDKAMSQELSAKALELQFDGHPNAITKLLYFLVRDKFDDAQSLADTIDTSSIEKETADSLIKEFIETNPFE